MINTNALKGAIVSAGYTQRSLARALGMSENTMNSKVNGRSEFTTSEIMQICRALSINDDHMKIQIFYHHLPNNGKYKGLGRRCSHEQQAL
ncbi:MAG: helix-turn-helix domain-containing protein [Christensenellales bacterium]|jgi:transcriptional regulator with XRE-family HTH domain